MLYAASNVKMFTCLMLCIDRPSVHPVGGTRLLIKSGDKILVFGNPFLAEEPMIPSS